MNANVISLVCIKEKEEYPKCNFEKLWKQKLCSSNFLTYFRKKIAFIQNKY